jgi:hypothetical protein
MKKYKHRVLSDEEYYKIGRITINFPLIGNPVVLIEEHKIRGVTPDNASSMYSDQLIFEIDPLDISAPLIQYDVDTGLPTTDDITQKRLFRILFSLYMKLATERDV